MNFTMTKIAAAAALALASSAAMAAPVATGGSFLMYSQAGFDTAGVVPMANLVNTDNALTGFVDQVAGTWGVASTAPFNFQIWTATNGSLIDTAGTYSLNTTTGAVSSVGSCASAFDGAMCFNVGANQIAGTIDFAWGVNTGIRVVNVWNVNANGSLTNVLAPGMENGPFVGFNASFNLSQPGLITPVPEASTYGMMLAGLGLVGFAVRRRKLMA